MSERDDAYRLAEVHLAEFCKTAMPSPFGPVPLLVPLKEAIIDTDYGWIIPVESEAYLRTKDPNYRVYGGISALIVLKSSHEIHHVGAGKPLQRAVSEFEHQVLGRATKL